MGLSSAELELRNPGRETLAPIEAEALADRGAVLMCSPEHTAVPLRFDPAIPEQQREATVAHGRRVAVPYIGPIRVAFKSRSCSGRALVMGDQVSLGAVPMEDMDLVVIPGRQPVGLNPEGPSMANTIVKTTAVEPGSRARGHRDELG